ncbi:chorismate pyruvate-lyase family protein [Nocardia sp. BMG51109]|uniref:chorismate pyruvate-lyase family protein n=1 Tax=Nocardia sp. BMG51109 TaxID=1056816 RepID=UPI0004B6DD8F|nr:chorismate pyruvate-lyase family protein [Nocardia sp. BMG51109]
MLLSADGSTTTLLEALTGQRLTVEVIDQRAATAVTLSETIRTALRCATDDDPVIVRRSRLSSEAGALVSVNAVVITGSDRDLTALLAQQRLPIGHSLAAAGRHLGRTVLSTGRVIWPADEDAGGIPCACKESVLLDHTSAAVAYLHERFNPAYVPVCAD